MENLESRLEKIVTNNEQSQTSTITTTEDGGDKWGLPLKDLYRLGLSFFKGKLLWHGSFY